MQYHPHGSLEAKIHDNGPVGWADALHIGVKVAGALETAHRRETLHRDVKPANILLTEYGEPQLTDFGIARIIGGFETGDGAVMGSPAYTAPEVSANTGRSLSQPGVDCSAPARVMVLSDAGRAMFGSPDKHPDADPRDSGLPTDARHSQAMSRDIAAGDRGLRGCAGRRGLGRRLQHGRRRSGTTPRGRRARHPVATQRR
jgi:serine/threonine-protein kinase PknK